MTEPQFAKMKAFVEHTQRFAAAWAEEITQAFEPFNEAVSQMQKRPVTQESRPAQREAEQGGEVKR